MDRFLLAAMVFVVAGNAMLASTLKVLPANPVLITLGAIVVLRLLGAFALSTALRALRARAREATATDADRRAFQRLHGTSMLLIGIEGLLAIVLLFLVS
jgi:NhaP-type Na+/H+ or K+/H+ antiporter